jgi:hypothetical protein
MRSFGYFFHIGAQIQSAAELAMEIGMEVIHASIGDSSEAWAALTPVPMWQQITTLLSAQAFHSGIPVVVVDGRIAMHGGVVGQRQACTPWAASRFTSAAAACMSHHGTIISGMKRPGAALHQSCRCQSL